MKIEKYDWLQEVIKAEEKVEETGIVDFDQALNPERILVTEALRFMNEIKHDLEEAIEIFNEMKPTPAGKIKVYAIAKTHADFMIFRNGYKLLFSLIKPGVIAIRFHYMNTTHQENETIEIKWGAFNDVIWVHKGHPIKKENLIRYFLVKFIRESLN
jgi:hypothetical protein